MHLPRVLHADGAEQRSDYALKIKKNLYGLKQASYNWSELLKEGLLQLGFTQSIVDPCLYFKYDIICAIYVDDTIIQSPDDYKIDQVISGLKELNFELIDEGDVDSFLGIKIDTADDDTIIMSQPALIEKIIHALGLEKTLSSTKLQLLVHPYRRVKHLKHSMKIGATDP